MAAVATRPRRSNTRIAGGLILSALALLAVCAASILLGSRTINLAALAQTDLTVILDMRVPRTVLGLLAGAALAVSGTLLQGVARNPLADPGIMGINAGAAVAVVTGILVLGRQATGASVWLAFLGAGAAIAAVYTTASFGREGATPVKLALAGVVVTAVCSSVTSAIVLADADALEELRVWQVGALAGRYWPVVLQVGPYVLVGLVAAMFLARPLNLLALGDALAISLGQHVRRNRTITFVVVAVLCGAATAACGPIAFLGLMVPHLVRLVTGPDYRWILAYSFVLGPLVLLLCDIVGRLVSAPGELQVGVVLGVVGAPVFITIVRLRRGVEL
ncbi:iron complex transport system permease protein [Promicromonospora sp. AC04]|uniref:FecCD family ABC transporter permease n=1 Tax=Promicromonospora sp. AC04 TaxID=2135723 RepID=UPI000D3BE99E|nr:iron ABC transporter permease [Promicromonospora sp. AC04]PUB32059.1 iron complex transport system permease protein [Promicromonospora sp. AC04]